MRQFRLVRPSVVAAFGAAVVLALSALLAPPTKAAEETTEDQASGNGKLVLLLDSSGSMEEENASGEPKSSAAKSALNTVVEQLPDGSPVGLRVYGATVFSAEDEGACADSQLVAPIAPVDDAHTRALKDAIGEYRPYGETPTGYALKQAAKDLGTEGKRSIVLVSDGEATCEPDPCVVAGQLAEQGIDLRIDVIGLNVDGAARKQLQCIADKGRGTYYDADDSEDLVASITRMATRAFRPFSVTGTPVRGTTAPGSAPALEPGQYTETIGTKGSGNGVKYYRVPYRAGATLHLNATARPPRQEGGGSDGLQLRLQNAEGIQCGYAGGQRVESSGGSSLLSATLVAGPDRKNSSAPEECWGAEDLILEVERKTEAGDQVPIELVYTEEPPVENASALPEAITVGETTDARVVPEADSIVDVAGGASFSDAPRLQSGSTAEDTLRPGELLFYRVRVDWGQSAAVTFRLKPDSRAARIMGDGEAVNVRAYAPDRSEIATSLMPGNHESLYTGKEQQTYDFTLPEVRYNNRNGEFTARPASRAGDYYFAIELEKSGDGKLQVPMTISTDIAGEPTGTPNYASLSDRAASEKTDQSDQESSDAKESTNDQAAPTSGDPWLALVIGLASAAVILVVALAVVLRKRRVRGARPGPPSGPGTPR